ncbi:endonuclease/exonuclease/phosphatase family protein [Alicyclobacillus fastidiosus]|uniref:Endonuclease/exonuclease/phosphatase family protein n=1 Tax=Alicyclobacillus fastidiosus TaxID=392011 RepID=A0ABY6ZMH1_9BACL|nr:endonuclease/exonuclease/phosphatase family protein [Alicyclobacillus fastidiosus]WAH44128.1 endonuclease/exonuclease/phosphatase family protein [Alicyclobacillus fastidiosus]GMA60429.1 hypothetical protein GCM10025859_08690 [Alicyclobacillus fastidiosus]
MSERSPLRILTINTWKCDGNYDLRMQALAKQISSLDPDVITLQESFRTVDGTVDTAKSLANALGMHCQFAQARRKTRMVKARVVESDSGLAMLSRVPIQSTHRLVLPTDSPSEERVALLGILDWHGVVVNIANVHFTHLPERMLVKRAQLSAVLDACSTDAGIDVHANLICGDFNTPLHELQELLAGRNEWTIRDSYVLGGGESERITIRGIGADWPDAVCIDYILHVQKSTESSTVRFEDSSIVLNQPNGKTGVFPSDHYGVMTTMHFVNGGEAF